MHSILPTLHILTAPGREASLKNALASLRASDWPCDPVIHTDRGASDTEPQIRRAAAWRDTLASAAIRAGIWTASDEAGIQSSHRRRAPMTRWCASSEVSRIPEALPDSRRAGWNTNRATAVGTNLLPAVSGPMILIMEDNVLFNPNIASRLLEWPPLVRGSIHTFASLHYGSKPGGRPGSQGPAFLADTPATWSGSHALLIAPSFAVHCLKNWASFPGLSQGRRLGALAARDVPGTPVWIHVPSLVETVADPCSWSLDAVQTANICAAL